MKTSYFANRVAANDPKAVSIALWPPRLWKGRRYNALNPPPDLLRRSKAGLPWLEYVKEYDEKVLAKLDPVKVYNDLSDSILLCWERPGEHCHRQLVAIWIKSRLGIDVPEL